MRKKRRRTLKPIVKIFLFFFVAIVCAYIYLNSDIEDFLSENTPDLPEPMPNPNIEAYQKCINSDEEFSNESLSEEFLIMKQELESQFNSNVSIVYKGLTQSNLSISHNVETIFYAASVIKMALAIYIYQEAELNPELLNEELLYKATHRVGGSGIMKDMDRNRPFTVRELVKYLIEESDNIAFYMLLDEFKSADVRLYWEELGTTQTFSGWDKFGMINGSDAQIYSEELYRYLNTNTPLSEELGSFFLNAAKDSITQTVIESPIYFKYGLTNPNYHEISIVNAEHPYILNIITTLHNKGHENYIRSVAASVDELNSRYWQDKLDYCLGIYPH